VYWCNPSLLFYFAPPHEVHPRVVPGGNNVLDRVDCSCFERVRCSSLGSLCSLGSLERGFVNDPDPDPDPTGPGANIGAMGVGENTTLLVVGVEF